MHDTLIPDLRATLQAKDAQIAALVKALRDAWHAIKNAESSVGDIDDGGELQDWYGQALQRVDKAIKEATNGR